MKPPDLILGSQSTRRRDLMEQWGYRFHPMTPPYQDPPTPPAGDPRTLAVELAAKKARSLFSNKYFSPSMGAVVVGADTIVIDSQGHLLGQPQSRVEADLMLDAITESTHEVVTGVCVTNGKAVADTCFVDTARVRVGCLTEVLRETHLDGGGWQGKAGGYDLWDVADVWPVEVDGDPTTVAGLPMRRLVVALRQRGITPSPGSSERPPMPSSTGNST